MLWVYGHAFIKKKGFFVRKNEKKEENRMICRCIYLEL